MVHLRKNHFPAGVYHKLHAKRVEPCRVIHKVNDNAYVVDLPQDLQISNTFNVTDLTEYYPPDGAATEEENSELSFTQSGGG